MQSLERHTSLDAAITSLGAPKPGMDAVQVRLVLADGTDVEGRLLSVSVAEVCLRVSDTHEDVPLEVIKAIYVARPRAARSLILGVAAIVAGTGAMVVYSLMPWVVIDTTDWLEVFGGVALTGGVIWKLLARSAGFRTWQTRWEALYEP